MPDTRDIGLVPWDFEPGGKYKLRYGVDGDGDDQMDKVEEEREFLFKQVGQPIPVKVEPKKTYVIEIDNLERGRPVGLYPDPAVCADDLEYDAAKSEVAARIHNVGSKAAQNITVDFYQGDPKEGGVKVGSQTIANLEAPIDLEPRTQTVTVSHKIAGNPQDIFVMLDAGNAIEDEITTFNNTAHAILPKAKVEIPQKKPVASPMSRGADRFGPGAFRFRAKPKERYMASGENDLNSILSSMTAEEKGGQVLMVPPTKERNRDLRLGSWLVKDTDLDENLETATAIVAEMQRMNAETSRIPIWMHGFVYRASLGLSARRGNRQESFRGRDRGDVFRCGPPVARCRPPHLSLANGRQWIKIPIGWRSE